MALVYGEDPEILNIGGLMLALWFKGFPEQAIARSHEALDKAEELSHALSTGDTYLFAARFIACAASRRKLKKLHRP